MRSAKLLLMIGMMVMTFTACQKEQSFEIPNNAPDNGGGNNNGGNGGTTNGSEIGTWKLIGVHVNTSVTIEMSLFGQSIKTLTISDYDTKDNKGTIAFDGKKMNVTGMEYNINATATAYSYINGSLDDSLSFPMSGSLPPTDQSLDYKKIGSDSLSLTSGMPVVGSSGQVSGVPMGYRLKWYDDKMTMTMNYMNTKTGLEQGVPATTTTKFTTVTTLQKQ